MAARGSTADTLVVGGGVIGLTIARELKRRHPRRSVTVIEKETSAGLHASGRNSGVLHAGFYYTADSLKARFCRAGNQQMQDYCAANQVRVNRCGKLVVARDESELAGLDELFRRGQANGVPLEMISRAEAERIEPRVLTHERAIWSPTTATVDPAEVMRALAAEVVRMGVTLRTGARYLSRDRDRVRTSAGDLAAGYVVNAAGLYADRVARDFGFAARYRILPFKGLYLKAADAAPPLKTNVYPVPDLRFPFLGVHLTLTADQHTKIGPTAIPCLWREQYGALEGFRLDELVEVCGAVASMWLRAGFDFRGLAREEMRKYHRPYLVAQAALLARDVRPADFTAWGRSGIRAQLYDLDTRRLIMDFCTEGDERSFHVLNAVSPAFTCALPFSEHVCDRIDALQHDEAAPAALARTAP